MHDQKIIRKIFSLARYDFSQNFTHWFSITGLHATIITIIFCSICYLTSDYHVASWGWTPNLFFDWIHQIYALIFAGDSWKFYGVGGVFVGLIVCCALFFPLVLQQNALDLAFDSSMSGYSLKLQNLRPYFIVRLISLCGVFCISMSGLSLIGYVQSIKLSNNFLSLACLVLILNSLLFCFLQLTTLLSMHILEYKLNVLESSQQLLTMLAGRIVFLFKIVCLQILTILCFLTALYCIFETTIKIIMPLFLWIFKILSLPIPSVFVVMISNFFYGWVYVLFYAWMCLVTAHVYRQLICPPVENAACQSCDSCHK